LILLQIRDKQLRRILDKEQEQLNAALENSRIAEETVQTKVPTEL
jgi:hypothetical protein